MVWVWGDNGPDAGLESALQSPPLVAELDDAAGLKSGQITPAALSQRDLPYGWDTLIENLVVGGWRHQGVRVLCRTVLFGRRKHNQEDLVNILARPIPSMEAASLWRHVYTRV